MTVKIINRVALVGFIVWTVILVVGVAVEIGLHELIFDSYLSGSLSWMLICAVVYDVTKRLSRKR